MAGERESHIKLPDFMVAPENLGPFTLSSKDLALMDEFFPKPEPRTATVEELQRLGCPADLIPLIQQLDTPKKVQEYVNSHLTYDHSDDTRGFVGVARDGLAHCYEGAIFIYTVLQLNGWNPRAVLLSADNKYGEDHNIVVYRQNDRLGSVAMSSWQTLKDRPPIFTSLRDLVAIGYWNAYTSELPGYAGVHNLIGYTDPISLVKKFPNLKWMFREGKNAELSIFKQYVRGAMCTNIFTGERYLYQDEVYVADASDDQTDR